MKYRPSFVCLSRLSRLGIEFNSSTGAKNSENSSSLNHLNADLRNTGIDSKKRQQFNYHNNASILKVAGGGGQATVRLTFWFTPCNNDFINHSKIAFKYIDEWGMHLTS